MENLYYTPDSPHSACVCLSTSSTYVFIGVMLFRARRDYRVPAPCAVTVPYGLGVKHAAIKDKLDLGADYSTTRSRSQINVNTGLLTPAFPEITATLDTLKLYATYHMKETVSLQAGYWIERYSSKDWMLDGVAPTTIPNVLTMGLAAPQYHVNVLRLSVRYKF